MFIDPLYLLFLAPGILVALWAQLRTRSAFHEGMRYASARRLTGARVAARVMEAAGVGGVAIEPVEGFLTDHYDPGAKVLRLSPEVFHGESLSAVGVAAHEAGHAIQDATRYGPLVVRNAIVPLAGFGSNVAWLLIMMGFALMAAESVWGRPVLYGGIGAFSLTVLFQLVNLPVEFDASRRARQVLLANGLVTPQEDVVVKRVLSAAAMTYVAATLTAVLTLLYFLVRAGLLSRSRG